MPTSNRTRSHGAWHLGAVVFSSLAMTVAISVSVETTAEGNGAGVSLQDLRNEAEIKALSQCFASGEDAIGRGDVAGARTYFRRCFTANAVLEASFPNHDPNTPADFTAVGPDAMVDLVAGVFSSSGYTATQHLISVIDVDIHNHTATMSTNLIATHVLNPFGSIDLANGVYDDQVVRTPAGWKISHRTLTLLTYMRVDSPPAP